jgi:hypothetical protein
MIDQVATVFGLHGRPYAVNSSGVTDISKLAGTTLTVSRVAAEDSSSQAPAIDGSACK